MPSSTRQCCHIYTSSLQCGAGGRAGGGQGPAAAGRGRAEGGKGQRAAEEQAGSGRGRAGRRRDRRTSGPDPHSKEVPRPKECQKRSGARRQPQGALGLHIHCIACICPPPRQRANPSKRVHAGNQHIPPRKGGRPRRHPKKRAELADKPPPSPTRERGGAMPAKDCPHKRWADTIARAA